MTGYLTPFAALKALIARAFTNTRSTQRSTQMVELFPAAHATIKRSNGSQHGESDPSLRRRVDRD